MQDISLCTSFVDFMRDFRAATAKMARAVDRHLAPTQALYLGFDKDKVEALSRACHEALATAPDGNPYFDFDSAMQVIRLLEAAFNPYPEPPASPELTLLMRG
jgi:hypothetical protein